MESIEMKAKRGDHASGWYLTDKERRRCTFLKHNDWCLFDDRGRVGIDKNGRAVCFLTKTAAELCGPALISGFADPIECPIKIELKP